MIDKEIFKTFESWLNEAKREKTIIEPTAMCLSTCGEDGMPAGRIVLLKHYDHRGFVFYSNHKSSHKANDIHANPKASLCFYWGPLKKQVRVEGEVEVITDERADAYFASRPRGSQIGAWASQQSRALESREAFDELCHVMEQKYAKKPVPRPPHWNGWRVIPQRIEFWMERDFRCHDRWEYRLDDKGSWHKQLLFP